MVSWTLVTGGAKRFGAEVCRHLASRGHHLVIHYRTSEKEADALATECRQYSIQVATIQGDFSSKESTQEFIQRYKENFPATRYLINNVGDFLIQSALHTPIDEWYAIFQNNTHAPFILSQQLVDSLKKHQGAIVNIGVAGLERGGADNYSTAYSCAKLALLLLTRSLAKELAPYQVRVNMISPGHLENSIDLPVSFKSIPMGRPASLKEGAELIAFLLSKEATYITGQNIELAGGLRL